MMISWGLQKRLHLILPHFLDLPQRSGYQMRGGNTYGGVYSWEDKGSCDTYRSGELYAGALANNPNFVNLSDKGFSVLDEPSKITHMK